MPILTTANHIKQNGIWCEDADEITQAGLDALGIGWDDKFTIQQAMENTGLGDALNALGAPLPRYKKQAAKIEGDYLRYLYHEAIKLAQRFGFTVMDVGQWLDREDRKISCLAQMRIWRDVEYASGDAGIANLARGMAFIFDASKAMIHRTVMGTRHIVTAQRLLEDETASQQTINLLKSYLKGQLDNV